MNKILLSVMGIIVIVGGFLLIGRAPESAGRPAAATFSSVQAETRSGARLIDVRTPEEYTASHFDRAENWPLQSLQAGKFPYIDKSAKVYLYCQSGNRSAQSAAILRSAGYTDVVDLGGLKDVQEIGGILINNKEKI